DATGDGIYGSAHNAEAQGRFVQIEFGRNERRETQPAEMRAVFYGSAHNAEAQGCFVQIEFGRNERRETQPAEMRVVF
ncbi:MAG: hypothetical protein IJQ06_06505, partial [Paludibacteraceae bacterium]|nr:hypothetical protein [Paludibacteraceae bacterium]